MALWDRVVEVANKAMRTEASQILKELRAECPKRTGATARSFHIMSGSGGMTNGIEGVGGIITNVRIGSTKDTAYFADQGNGTKIIYPVKAKALKFHDGSYHNYARPYMGTNFVAEVANRHR